MELHESKRVMWSDKLKELGVSIHVIATGAGAGLQQELWEVPGSSAYLSGASFPYAPEEQEEILGFMPEHFCSEENAIDLASAAYMKAYRFGGKKPIGIGITASVASERAHRGEHRVFACVITNDKVGIYTHTFPKEVGQTIRILDGHHCDAIGRDAICYALGENGITFQDATELAKARFFERPFFTVNGKRLAEIPNPRNSLAHYAMMPGAYNPPHEGHFGMADEVAYSLNKKVIFEITAEPPHKDLLTVQQLLQRAKLLQGHDRIFTRKNPFYLDKAKAFPGMHLVLGADAMVRMLDPKWGLSIEEMFSTLQKLEAKLFVVGREVNGVFTTCKMILDQIKINHFFQNWIDAQGLMLPVEGKWDVSSTNIRNTLV